MVSNNDLSPGPVDIGPDSSGLNLAVLSAIPRAISITSGKGGVGKSNIVANLAVCLAMRGKKVLIIDCDLGLSNIDVLMGLNPPYNLMHALKGEMNLKDVLVTGPAGVRVLPAPFGVQEITSLTREQKLNLLAILERMDEEFDVILLDTGAGISSNVMFFNMLANHIVVVMTPDPSSMTDAYALIKVMNTHYDEQHFHLLVNNVRNDVDGLQFYRKLTGVTQNFLNVSVDYVGCLPHDQVINKSTLMCRPVVELFPSSATTQRFHQLAERIEKFPAASIPRANQQLWMSKFLNGNGGSSEVPEPKPGELI
jgi:flagellar biosynthesis protein FlhG